MKRSEFIEPRKVNVVAEGETFEFNSYYEMLGHFSDIKNTEEWAIQHENKVFHCHLFDKIGKIVDTFDNVQDAAQYVHELNKYFAICEEYVVEEIEEDF